MPEQIAYLALLSHVQPYRCWSGLKFRPDAGCTRHFVTTHGG